MCVCVQVTACLLCLLGHALAQDVPAHSRANSYGGEQAYHTVESTHSVNVRNSQTHVSGGGRASASEAAAASVPPPVTASSPPPPTTSATPYRWPLPHPRHPWYYPYHQPYPPYYFSQPASPHFLPTFPPYL
ncbi:hypothetical protein PR048_003670 [Dryococelus australis]|uniref:Uncharacterized protein n=1 Tax=Dryococelus australis TaxID=614101 RepID=A0ABQ9INP1_9NEOP|nr:hypothetical protein PR048_003670 [Dryococelus australis]